jgi:diadenosine tetraphosphate (Ap4A) HIT family hydrolase
MAFVLHPQLQQDSELLTTLKLCEVRLMNNALYPWLILVPQRTDISEIFELNAADQAQLWQEITIISQALKNFTNCHKINTAALGNVVPQLHIHIIARFKEDVMWPKPVWGGPAQPYDDLNTAITHFQLHLRDI